MQAIDISIIIPSIMNEEKLGRFCSSLFSSGVNAELFICGKISENIISDISQYSDKITVFDDKDNYSSLIKAFEAASGERIMLSYCNAVFSENSLIKLISESVNSACVCNAAVLSDGQSTKLYRTYFSIEELSGKPVFINFILRKSVILYNHILPVSASAFSILNFIADYLRFDDCNLLHEVMIYLDSEPEISLSKEDIACIEDYANAFAVSCNDMASMFFLRNILTTFQSAENKEIYKILKTALQPFYSHYAVCAWIRSSFSIDVDYFTKSESDFESFTRSGKDIWYKEVCLPISADDVIMKFYSGKFGADTLKKCIGAWLYFKIYRKKSGFIGKIGCKICKRLLGGDFNA